VSKPIRELEDEPISISVIVPTYEAKGLGESLTKRAIDSILSQTFERYEIVVSDHSRDTSIQDLCQTYGHRVRYLRNSHKRGNSSANMNFGIQHATGNYIKILHMDDRLCDDSALEAMAHAIAHNDARWGVFWFDHQHEGTTETIRLTIPGLETTLGCPSTSFFPRCPADPILFDENLIIINDHDMHQTLLLRFGIPAIIPILAIRIGLHPDQVSNTVDRNRLKREVDYFHTKRLLMLDNQLREQSINASAGAAALISSSERIGTQANSRMGKLRTMFKRLKGLGTKGDQAHHYYESGHSLPISERAALLDDELSELANQYATDKGTRIPDDGAHHGPRLRFTPVYEFLLAGRRRSPLKLLEVGIGSGASLSMWADYFPHAQIFGIDIEPFSGHLPERVETFQIDATDRVALTDFARRHGPFDVVIDDGGHMMGQQQIALGVLFPFVSASGDYLIEDLHTSWWPFGKYRNLYRSKLDINRSRSNTTIRFLQDFVATGRAASEFLTYEENRYLTDHVGKLLIFDLPDTEYGPNRLGLIRKVPPGDEGE
jgi:glycosyltransferase involved in cell wall biosynthesis